MISTEARVVSTLLVTTTCAPSKSMMRDSQEPRGAGDALDASAARCDDEHPAARSKAIAQSFFNYSFLVKR